MPPMSETYTISVEPSRSPGKVTAMSTTGSDADASDDFST